MNQELTFEQVKRAMLLRSIYVLALPIFMIFAVLACVGTALTSLPTYTCPTDIPPVVTPGTPMPRPATPYVIMPPQDFYRGDAVFVGSPGAAQRVRFRLQNVSSTPASPDTNGPSRRIYTWQLQVRNAGSQEYDLSPALQMYLSEVNTATGTVTGTWGSTRAAADEAGLTIDNEVYTLASGQTRTFRFAAYAPAGTAHRFTFTLDPTVTEGSSVITWANQDNPYCSGDVAD